MPNDDNAAIGSHTPTAPAETGALGTPAPACIFHAKFAWPITLKAALDDGDERKTPAGIHAHFNGSRNRIEAAVKELEGVQSAAVSGHAVEIPDVGSVAQKTMVTLELKVPLGPVANDEDLKAAGRAFQELLLVPALQTVQEVGGTVAIGSMKKR